jgi:hypothetical protein
MKQCITCKITKELTEFHKSKTNKDKLSNYCKQCSNARRKQSYYDNIERETQKNKNYRKTHPRTSSKYRWYTYKLSEEQYLSLLNNQQEQCAICLSKDKLCVDHDHTTLNIRGLLCSNCNTALGLVKENATTLQNMIAYLLRHAS